MLGSCSECCLYLSPPPPQQSFVSSCSGGSHNVLLAALCCVRLNRGAWPPHADGSTLHGQGRSQRSCLAAHFKHGTPTDVSEDFAQLPNPRPGPILTVGLLGPPRLQYRVLWEVFRLCCGRMFSRWPGPGVCSICAVLSLTSNSDPSQPRYS